MGNSNVMQQQEPVFVGQYHLLLLQLYFFPLVLVCLLLCSQHSTPFQASGR